MSLMQQVIVLTSVLLTQQLTVTTVQATFRQRRSLPLMFLRNTTTMHFICGFGVPVEELDFEDVNAGLVFKAEYRLPGSLEDFRHLKPLKVTARNAQQTAEESRAQETEKFLTERHAKFSQHRWMFYKTFISVLEIFGYTEGRVCVLRSICEYAAISFHHINGLIGELIHILLSPSTSRDKLLTHRDNEYLHAESLGRNNGNVASCARAFSECENSVLEQFFPYV